MVLTSTRCLPSSPRASTNFARSSFTCVTPSPTMIAQADRTAFSRPHDSPMHVCLLHEGAQGISAPACCFLFLLFLLESQDTF